MKLNLSKLVYARFERKGNRESALRPQTRKTSGKGNREPLTTSINPNNQAKKDNRSSFNPNYQFIK